MNKKRIVIGTISILILSTIFHNIYKLFPNFLTSILSPVNESIWEHNKMIFSSFLIWSISEKMISKNGKSICFLNFMTAIICILLLDSIFTPVYFFILNKKDSLIITLIIYTISIIASFIIGEKFLVEHNKKIEKFSILLYLSTYIIFGILTYYPLKIPIFYDFRANFYGIDAK